MRPRQRRKTERLAIAVPTERSAILSATESSLLGSYAVLSPDSSKKLPSGADLDAVAEEQKAKGGDEGQWKLGLQVLSKKSSVLKLTMCALLSVVLMSPSVLSERAMELLTRLLVAFMRPNRESGRLIWGIGENE